MPYLDTSALLKLLVSEPFSDLAWGVVEGTAPCTCRVSYAEARAALARRERESADVGQVVDARARLGTYWPRMRVIEVTQALVEKAGEFADAFSLRGYDAVQLAAAHHVAEIGGEPVHFVCFDRRLNRAARLLGMSLPEGVPS